MQLAYLLRRSPVAVVFALTTFVLIANRAVRTADPYWDTLAYHWPFAARIAGLCDVNCFLMPPSFEYRYEGFPKLWHAIQGLLWRVTGTPTLGDLLSIAMVVVLCLYLNRRFRVPLAWSWLALLAIPEVQIQLTSSYVDLPLNAGVALALMVLLHILVNPAADQRSDLALAVAGLALAANGKPQLVVVSLFVWTIIVLVVSETPSSVHLNRRSSTLLALSLIGGATLLPHFLLNLYTFGNPFYPIAFGIGRFRFPGPEAMMQTTSTRAAAALDIGTGRRPAKQSVIPHGRLLCFLRVRCLGDHRLARPYASKAPGVFRTVLCGITVVGVRSSASFPRASLLHVLDVDYGVGDACISEFAIVRLSRTGGATQRRACACRLCSSKRDPHDGRSLPARRLSNARGFGF